MLPHSNLLYNQHFIGKLMEMYSLSQTHFQLYKFLSLTIGQYNPLRSLMLNPMERKCFVLFQEVFGKIGGMMLIVFLQLPILDKYQELIIKNIWISQISIILLHRLLIEWMQLKIKDVMESYH